MDPSERDILLVDLDGPLADFDRGFNDRWQAEFSAEFRVPLGTRKTFRMVDAYPEHLRESVRGVTTREGFFLDLPVVEGAGEALRQLREAGWRISICTSPLISYEHCVGEKYRWVERNLGSDYVRAVIMTRDKTLCRGRFLIDDNPKISGALEPAWEHILFDAPYNREAPGKRITRWSDWERIVGKPA